MKKFLGILVLGLLFSNNASSEELLNVKSSDLIKQNFELHSVNQTNVWDALRYTYVHWVGFAGEKVIIDKIVTCNVALDKKKPNRETCYLIAEIKD